MPHQAGPAPKPVTQAPEKQAETAPAIPKLEIFNLAKFPKQSPGAAAPTDEPAVAAEQDKEKPPIPAEILKKGEALGFGIDDIKLQGDTWVGCTKDTCTPLGTHRDPKVTALEEQLKSLPIGSTIRVTDPKPGERSEFLLSQSEVSAGGSGFGLGGFGKFTRNPDNKTYTFTPAPEIAGRVEVGVPAGYVPEVKVPLPTSKHVLPATMQEARAYVESHPDEAVVILVTVPKLCPPCLELEKKLPGMIDGLREEGKRVTVIKIEHETFEQAKADAGAHVKFPFLAMFARGNRDEVPAARDIQRGPVLEGLRGLRKAVFGVPGNLRDTLRELAQ